MTDGEAWLSGVAPPSLWTFKPCSNPDCPIQSNRNHHWREEEQRIDSRIRAFFSQLPFRVQSNDAVWVPMLNSEALAGGEALAPSEGLTIYRQRIDSYPDGNSIPICVMVPEKATPAQPLPCVVYCHGGGMSHYSCFYSNFQTLGRLLAHSGSVVVMVDFRNSETPSLQGEEVGPFPKGLQDCCSAASWAQANLGKLCASHIVMAGESGGGNLAISATLALCREGKHFVRGVYALCPMLCGRWGGEGDLAASWQANAGIFLDYDPRVVVVKGYGFATTEENEALHTGREALAWPGLYCEEKELCDVAFPPCAVVVNEFDPLRDDGVHFYERCVAAGLQGCSLQTLQGTTHGVGSYLTNLMPEVTKEQCRRLVDFANQLAPQSQPGAA